MVVKVQYLQLYEEMYCTCLKFRYQIRTDYVNVYKTVKKYEFTCSQEFEILLFILEGNNQ